jgi:D-amino peptidase
MKLLIAVDMEGISGVTSLEHTNPAHAEYQRFRRLMTQDVNAAVRGAVEGGVNDLTVADGHWNGTNILIEELDAHARLQNGSPSPFSMVQGAQLGVDAAIFIGYHARMGTASAVLDHTWSSAAVQNLWLNSRLAGETALNGAVVGSFGAPVLLVSGDQSVCAEAASWIPGIAGVQVKRATGRHSAECLPPAEAQALIQSGVAQAVRAFLAGHAPAPLRLETPVKVGLELTYSDMADRAVLLPGAVRVDGRKLEFSAPSMPEAYFMFRAAVTLAQR